MSIIVESGVTSSGCIVENDTMEVFGSALQTTVNSGGSMFISSGGAANNTTVNYYGRMYISGGGAASSTTVNSRSSMTISSGGAASGTTVNGGGSMFISSGGVAENTIVNSGHYTGFLLISSGGSASIVFNPWQGKIVSSAGAVVTYLERDAGVYIRRYGESVSKTDVWESGICSGAAIVYDGGVVSGTIVSGGQMVVSSGGVASGTIVSGGQMVVSSGGAADDTTVSNGGVLTIFSGGVASSATFNSNGWMYISSGGVASNTTVNSDGRMFVSGGAVSGRLEIAEGAIVSAYAGAVIDFTAAEQTTSGAAFINDWSRIGGRNNADYTLTVVVDQAAGEYALAAGAASFNKTVTVKTAETELRTLEVGGTLVYGDTAYTLNKTDGLLSLTVVGSTPLPPLTVAEVILTITDPNHDYYGAMGGWKVQADQTVAWQDLTTLGDGYSYLGLGRFTAGKAMPDIYVYNAVASYIAAYITDDTGAITGFETAFLGSGALGQVGLADFTADGVSDLLLRTADGFVGYYANGAFNEVQGLGLEWSVAALGDLDGNDRADVVIAHDAGYVGAYLVGNDGSISWANLGYLDSSSAIVGAGDVNGDGTDDVIVQVGASYYGAWLCGGGTVTGFFGIGTFDATVQDIADYNADGTDDLLLRTADGVVGAALITGADATTWSEYGALGAEWSTKGVGIL